MNLKREQNIANLRKSKQDVFNIAYLNRVETVICDVSPTRHGGGVV